jgi:hypothetical protein
MFATIAVAVAGTPHASCAVNVTVAPAPNDVPPWRVSMSRQGSTVIVEAAADGPAAEAASSPPPVRDTATAAPKAAHRERDSAQVDTAWAGTGATPVGSIGPHRAVPPLLRLQPTVPRLFPEPARGAGSGGVTELNVRNRQQCADDGRIPVAYVRG